MGQYVHAVPASVVSSLRDRTTKHTARLQWKDEEIQRVTDWAQQFGIKQAIKRHAEIPDEDRILSYFTVNSWLQHYSAVYLFRQDPKNTKIQIKKKPPQSS